MVSLSPTQLKEQRKTFQNLNTIDDNNARDITYEDLDDGLQLVGNAERTALEIKRACLHPDASLENETVRRVRAASIGLSLYQYEKHLDEMGVVWQR